MSFDDSPVTVSDNGDITIRNVALAGSGQAVKISMVGEKVSNIEKTEDPIQWICLPPLVDMHVHANRAFTIAGAKPESFEHAIQLTTDLLQSFNAEQYCSHAMQLFKRAYSHATTGIRTHADIDSHTGLETIKGTLEAKNIVGQRMDIEVVAFATVRMDPASKEGRSAIKNAIDMGADIVGAVPNYYQDPRKSIDALMELATELDVPVDVHQDEHLLVNNVWSEYLADATISNGYQGRVTLSHGCVLSVLDIERRDRIIDKLSAANICVVALPTTNLYLQDRHAGTPLRRGLTCVHELLEAGVNMRFASDNVCDAFYPYGDADLLDTAYVAMLASQIDADENLLKSICAGRSQIGIGDSADLVLIKAMSFDEVMSKRSTERALIRQGKLISSLLFS